MQRRQRVSPRRAVVGGIGERQTLLVVQLRDDRVDFRVQPVDALEMRGHHLTRRHVPCANQRFQLSRSQETEVVHTYISLSVSHSWGMFRMMSPHSNTMDPSGNIVLPV